MAIEVPQAEPQGVEELLDALADLVAQIDRSEFRDKRGHALKMNMAYREAVTLLALYGRPQGGTKRP